MGQAIRQVDAFTATPFAGNPAAVCVLPGPADAQWMQQVACEMNLAETAFLYRQEDGFNLRWFTPTVEVDLCGHATLASAHILWEEGYLQPDELARFHTRSGLLTATLNGDWIELNFPAAPASVADAPREVVEALGVAPTSVASVAKVHEEDYLLELDGQATVRDIGPDLTRLEHAPARVIMVTARSDSPEYDFVVRVFAPRLGLPEDPVTGSVQCTLAPYWSQRLGKPALVAYQASPRGGVLRVRDDGERVAIGGQAVTVLRGELLS
jgi:PhzF family phenazine biosynthesis protein